jgi:hypothetical protein
VPPTFGAASFGKLRQCQTASSNRRSHIEQVLGQIISGVFTLNFELIKSLEHFSAALDHPTGTKQQLFRACDALDRVIQGFHQMFVQIIWCAGTDQIQGAIDALPIVGHK